MKNSKRLDVAVVDLGLLPSRQAAQAAIIDGGILVDGVKITKPGTAVKEDARITLLSGWQLPKYVSRGGLKLEKALDQFAVDVKGQICLDVGASTGGFTDCLLQRGALKVYAIDVGYGQLDWRLRNDERVVVKERINARSITPQVLYGEDANRASVAVVDVSFISLAKVLPALVISLRQNDCFDIITLVKPQFEAGKQSVKKGGVVADQAVHKQVLADLIQCASALALDCLGLTYSPLKGPAGNIEFLAHFRSRPGLQKTASETTASVGPSSDVIDVARTVTDAHQDLSAHPHQDEKGPS
jgi:23S rRNA (cytidine1920-2'-O)/16S rRNA (cytidine1409-2'-O)-methyltransferase